MLSFGFIVNNEKQDTFENLNFFTNATFFIIILSFITSLLGTWSILDGPLVLRMYSAYFVFLFAILHGEVLSKTTKKQASIDNIVIANYIFMVIVVTMLMVVIFTLGFSELGGAFYRIFSACGIIDATLTLVAVIMHKLYLQKHPEVKDPVFSMPYAIGQVAIGSPIQQRTQVATQKRHTNIFVKILIGYAVIQIGGGIALLIIGFTMSLLN